jgi:hypothetical protein
MKKLEVTVLEKGKTVGIETDPDANVVRTIAILQLAIERLSKSVESYISGQLENGLSLPQINQLVIDLDFMGLDEFKKSINDKKK